MLYVTHKGKKPKNSCILTLSVSFPCFFVGFGGVLVGCNVDESTGQKRLMDSRGSFDNGINSLYCIGFVLQCLVPPPVVDLLSSFAGLLSTQVAAA